jgi:hypothetical protein
LTRISNAEDAVLPSSKRPARFYEPPQELVRNDEREAVYSSVADFEPARERESHDEDPTLLFTGSTHSILPPRPDTPVPEPEVGKAPRVPSLRGAMRIPTPRPDSMRGSVLPRSDSEDRTILRPVPDECRPSRPTGPPSAHSGGKARRAPPERRTERTSDVGDPPSAVITAKRRVVEHGSKKSLAAALVTLGVFVGLITAVVARGDADSLLDATARLVDPSHASAGRSRAAATQALTLPVVVDTTPKAAPLGSDQNPAPGACLPPSEAVPTTPPVVISAPPPAAAARTMTSAKAPAPAAAEPSTAAPRPSAPKAAPVASAPARPSPKASAAPAGGAVASSASGNSHERAARASKPASSSPDYEGAAAADALAKAQLEASLR